MPAPSINAYHDWADDRELVIQEACLLNVAGLEGNLQTRAAHTKPHAVHVDVVWFGIAMGTGRTRREVLREGRRCVGVFEDLQGRTGGVGSGKWDQNHFNSPVVCTGA
jgi:hypothetical protein